MENETVTLTFSVEKVNLILTALAELPYRVSAEMINEVREQAGKQLQKEDPAAAPQA
jgi:hypothetical protein